MSIFSCCSMRTLIMGTIWESHFELHTRTRVVCEFSLTQTQRPSSVQSSAASASYIELH
ncbi:hypothetical protein MPTK1_3g03100 [Marchantia polymorpha subsp. ruderalis]